MRVGETQGVTRRAIGRAMLETYMFRLRLVRGRCIDTNSKQGNGNVLVASSFNRSGRAGSFLTSNAILVDYSKYTALVF